MDNKMIAGIALLVIVIAGGWYLLARGPVPSGTSQSAAAGAAVQPQTGTGTLGGLLAMGSVQCTVSVDENGTQGQGTVYVAEGKMTGDFSSTLNGQTMNAYMINDGTTIYSWTDQTTQGFKMPVPAATATTSASASQGVSNTTPAQYSCTPWTVDENAFVPPATITFVDMAAMKAKVTH